MRTATVEICVDAPNAAILRPQDPHFPGVPRQGDTLLTLVQGLAKALRQSEPDICARRNGVAVTCAH